jgi:hypothetical protein
MLGLNPIASVTLGYKLSNVPLHVLPLEHLSHISIHLRTTRVDTVLGVMCLRQDLLADVFITWNTNLILAPTYSLLILMKLGGFAPLHDLENFLDRGTALLGLADVFFEIVSYPQLTQWALWHYLKLEITHFLTQLS